MTIDQYILEATYYANKIRPVDMYSFVFLETQGDPVANDIAKNNSENAEKSKSLIKKAIDLIKRTYEKIKNMLSEFKNRLLLSPSEKKDYDDFCQKIKNDPEFKNKKVSVKNWKEINIRYNDCVKTIQEELDKSKKDDYNMNPSIKKMIEDKITKFKDAAKNMTTSITIEELISKSKNDVNFADGMDLLINNDIVKLDKIVTGVNQADATRLSKEIHKASHRTWFSQKLSELRYTLSSQKAIDARERRRAIKALRKGTIRGLKESDPTGKLGKEAIDIGMKVTKQTGSKVVNDMKTIHNNKKAIRKLNKIQKHF